MEVNTGYKTVHYQSKVSFQPILNVLKRTLQHGSSAGAKKLYSGILDYADQHAELQHPIDDLSSLEPHAEWIEMLVSIIFPPTASENEMLYSVGLPFSYKTIYTSRLFHMLFIEPGTNDIKIPDNETGRDIEHDRAIGAYNLILRKYCNYHAPEFVLSVHPYHDPHSGLIKYMELQLDTRYIDVKFIGSHLPIPEDFINKKDHGLLSLEELQHNIPIEQFTFEGIVIGRVIDVTEREVISQMKSELLNLNAFSEGAVYHKLQDLVQSLIGLKDIRIGITPFFKVNGHFVFSELHNSNSLLFKHYKAVMERDSVNDCCRELFMETDKPIIYEKVEDEIVKEIDYLGFYFDQGYRSLILAPLKHNGDLWGILEIGSEHEGKLNYKHISKLDIAIPLFTRAIEKSAESLDNQIDKIIKEQFTAVQPSVEWKFTEAAYNFIIQRQQGKDPKPERIAFESVYPLYGAIDIRNSSVERSQSIQLDFIEQLQMAASVIKKAQASMPFPLLQEVQFKIDKHISSASDVLLNDEETSIHDFLQNQVASIFKHLKGTTPVI
ncbi:MAG TPA: GAF domain-containing protein, partial [Chitinophagaceae bacterium]|nr:GAF domain-containing protein [Chitinophagaceae bacterium]